jgi:polyisoprenoid-binding protein YceI
MKLIMKQLKHSYFLVTLIAVVLSACRGPEAKDASTSSANIDSKEGEKYSIDKKESVVTYKGSKAILSMGTHTGYVYLSKGELLMNRGQLAGGTFEVDMNTIADKDHGSENNLVRHLKSTDFFEVEKFPIAVFAVTMVVPTTESILIVTGNLTIKGITHAVTFPAKIEIKDGVIMATGNLAIDRTQWDVRYKSGKFGFNLVADEIIADDIEFDIKIVAKK